MTMPVLEKTDTRTLVLVRHFAAPRALLFQAWTEPERARIWWGPHGFEILSCQMDVRPGGAWRMKMRSPTGTIHVKHGTYQEIVPPERLVFTWAWEDAAGKPGPQTIVTVTFEEQSVGTRLTLRQTPFETPSARDAHHAGWSSCLDRFAQCLAQTATESLTQT